MTHRQCHWWVVSRSKTQLHELAQPAVSAASICFKPETQLTCYVMHRLLLPQVVAAVATLSKATQQLSSDTKSKMLSVVDTSIACAKVNKQKVTPDEATRMWAMVAAGHGIAPAGSTTAASGAAAGAGRHLLARQEERQLTHLKGSQAAGLRANSTDAVALSTSTSTSSYWDGSSGSRYQLFGPPPRFLLEGTTAFTEPAFLATAQAVAALLAASATSGSGYLSGGDNGLYVSVANQLGRSYSAAGAGVAAGPVLTGTGGAAAATSGSNAMVGFSKPLTSNCLNEDGSVEPGTVCRCVALLCVAWPRLSE